MILIIGLMIVVPILATQLADFISNLPGYITQLQSLLANRDSEWLKKYIGIDSTVIQQNLSSLLQQGAGFLSTLLQSLWNSGKSLIDIAGLFVVTPVVAFYMLLDWDRMVNSIDSWVPRKQLHTVRRIAREMNAAVAGFIRGQGTLCLILGTYYAIGLTLTGLNFGLLIGFLQALSALFPILVLLSGWRSPSAWRWCSSGPTGSWFARLRRCFPWPVHRRQYSPAQACRLFRGAASGLADVCAFRLWFTVRLHWNAGRRPGCGGCRGACAFCIE